MRMIALITWLGFSAVAVSAAQTSEPLLFDTGALAGWRPLAKSETVPYQVEQLGSELLFGARSQQGSYAFITRIDNTVRRPALVSEEVEAMISVDSFAAMSPVAFRTELGNAKLEKGSGLRCVVSSFRTRKLGYEIGDGAAEALVKTVFLPVVLWDREGEAYWNFLYVANFRGDPKHVEDLADFDRMWSHISIPERLSLIESHRFNALQPELAARSSPSTVERTPEPAKGTIHPTVSNLQENGEVDAAAFAMTLRDRLAGRESEAVQQRLNRIAQTYPGTVLAEVVSELDAERTFRLQKAVWNHVLASAEPTAKSRLVALFLAKSMDLEDWKVAEALTADATAAGLSLTSLDPADLGGLLDSLLRLRGAPPATSQQLYQFLALSDPGVVERLRPLLVARGLALHDLSEIAEPNRRGAWRLKVRKGKGSVPWIASASGKLVLLFPVRGAAKGLVEVTEVKNLLQLAESHR